MKKSTTYPFNGIDNIAAFNSFNSFFHFLRQTFFHNRYILIDRRSTKKFNDNVYNLSIDNDESYITHLGITHNCRCVAVQVRKSKYTVSDSSAAQEKGEKATTQICKSGINKAAIFRFNPGKEMKLMPPKHPYLPKGCGDCKFRKERNLYYYPDSDQCKACKTIAYCMGKANNPQNKAYDELLKWGMENIIGKVTYSNKAFNGRKATFVRNSFTENMGKGSLFFTKADVLNNIMDYLKDDLVLYEDRNITHGNGICFYKTTVKYKGNIPEFKNMEMELQFKEESNNSITFYFIKFLKK